MTRWAWLLLLSMTLPAFADEKKKDDKKKGASGAPSAEQFLAEADQKAAAGDLGGAVEAARKAVNAEPASGDAKLRLGRLLERKLDLDTAADAFRAASETLSGPAKGEALGRLAVIEELRGAPTAATTAEAAVAAAPEGAWPSAALARARARQGKGDEALALAQKATAAGGGPVAGAALGAAQEAKGDLAAAETAYRGASSAPEVDSGRLAASLGLARVLRQSGRAAEAGPLLETLLREAPGAVEAYKESARVKMALGKVDEAMGDAATAAALAENDPEAKRLVQQTTVARALSAVARNQAELAVRDLTALRDQDPEAAEVRVGLAKALLAQRQTEPALAELQKAVALDPASAEGHFQLGYVHHVVKHDPAGAVAEYDKAVAAEPGNLDYRTHLGAALMDAKQYDRAVTELQKVTSGPGQNRADAWIYLGATHLGAKRYKDAIAALDKAVALTPNSAQAEAYLGWCYFGLKDAENFKKHAGKARTLGHKEPTLLQYLTRIEGGEPIK